VWTIVNGMYDAAPSDDVAECWERFGEHHRAVFVVAWAMAEHSNGSLHQYYSNSTGDMAPRLPDAARLLGAGAYADIFERANALFAPATLADRRSRNDQLDEFERDGRIAQLDRLSDEIYDREDGGDIIYAAILRYIEEHRADFFRDPPS
jgi:hypothetical protein